MDLSFTSGLAELLEEQRRKRELEALQNQNLTPQEAELGATSPVLTPEVSTNGAQTAAPAGDGATAAYPGVLQRQGSNTGNFKDGPVAATSGQASPGNRGIGYGMSAAAEQANQLGADITAAGQQAADLSGLTPIQGQGNVRPQQLSDQTPDPNFDYTAAIANQRGLGGQLRLMSQQERGGEVTPQPNDPVQFNAERDQANKQEAEYKRMATGGVIGKALGEAGVAPPPPPADPLAPKPKLTARQRAEAEIPPVDDLKGWQKIMLVLGAGLAGGLAKDASLGAKLAALTPQNRRERLVKERVKEIQEQDKLDLDTKQAEAQIEATKAGVQNNAERLKLSAREQEFSERARTAGLQIDLERLQIDKDYKTATIAEKAKVREAREKYNSEVMAWRNKMLEAGNYKALAAGAQLINIETGQVIADNPHQPITTTTTNSEVATGPDGRQYRTDTSKTEVKAPANGGNGEGTRNIGGPDAATTARMKREYAKMGGEAKLGLNVNDYMKNRAIYEAAGGEAGTGLSFIEWQKQWRK